MLELMNKIEQNVVLPQTNQIAREYLKAILPPQPRIAEFRDCFVAEFDHDAARYFDTLCRIQDFQSKALEGLNQKETQEEGKFLSFIEKQELIPLKHILVKFYWFFYVTSFSLLSFALN